MDLSALPQAEGFNRVVDGKPVSLYSISAAGGASRCFITNYGARIVSLVVPDKNAAPTDVALGYNSLEEYRRTPEDYMGAIIGRCANRIAAGLFVLDGTTYVLPTNDNHNTLHGGPSGLHAQVWNVLKASTSRLALSYTAKDEEEGFPGNLDIAVTYEWTDALTLKVSCRATTDKATLVNLSNHTYFNLSGEGADTILDHELYVNADAITSVDMRMVPSGKLDPVKETPFDFTTPRALGSMIDLKNEQLINGGGYNHNFVLNSGNPVLSLRSLYSGITLEIATDRPCMQIYSGNHLDASRKGKSGRPYAYRSALVMAPQGFPDAIHHPQFTSVILRPGETYFSDLEYRFTT